MRHAPCRQVRVASAEDADFGELVEVFKVVNSPDIQALDNSMVADGSEIFTTRCDPWQRAVSIAPCGGSGWVVRSGSVLVQAGKGEELPRPAKLGGQSWPGPSIALLFGGWAASESMHGRSSLITCAGSAVAS
jgi:hypothetical protein